LLLDETYPPSIVFQLRRGGHDVGAVTERGDRRAFPTSAPADAATSLRHWL